MPTFFAVMPPGLEPVAARELDAHGLAGEVLPGGVRFEAPIDRGAPLAAWLRCPARLLLELAEGPATTTRQLLDLVHAVDWKPLLPRGSHVELAVSSRRSRLRFKDRIQRDVGKALARRIGQPRRPEPDQRLQIRLEDDLARLSLDCGGLLHRRGWRLRTAKAPIRENLAAALLIMAGWTGDEALVDPMCGAGTLPIEAARLAAGLPPGIRSYAFQRWPACAGWRPPDGGAPLTVPILGADRDPGAVAAAQDNAARAGVAVDWRHLSIDDLDPPAPTGLVVVNPPYGRRVGRHGDPGGAMVALGRNLRERFGGWRALFLAPEPRLAHKVHRDAERLTVFPNGGIRVGAWAVEL